MIEFIFDIFLDLLAGSLYEGGINLLWKVAQSNEEKGMDVPIGDGVPRSNSDK